MGINSRIRYALAWVLLKPLVIILSYTGAALAFVTVGITMFAFWFSPELFNKEVERIAEDLDK